MNDKSPRLHIQITVHRLLLYVFVALFYVVSLTRWHDTDVCRALVGVTLAMQLVMLHMLKTEVARLHTSTSGPGGGKADEGVAVDSPK